MPLASLQKPCSSSQGVRTPPGAERDLCLDSAMWPCGAWASRFHPALRPPPCRGPNCEEGLGNIFSVLILYFPFPPHNIKHNFALSVSLRLRFVDVSTWKHDPSASNGESSLRSLWEAASPPRLSGFLEHPERERETAVKARRVPTRTPRSFQIPSPCAAGANVFLMCVWLLACLFNKIPVCVLLSQCL